MLTKQNLLALNQAKLDSFFAQLGEKKYRTKQLMQLIYHKNVLDFDVMHNFSKDLRNKLKTLAELSILSVVERIKSSDGVIKWIIKADNNNYIETVYIPEKDRGTLCISSQVGCSLDCSFCATGAQGFNRNLKTNEIIAQVLIAKEYLSTKKKDISNIVFMGMGEPMLNEDSVYSACALFVDDYAFGLSRRKVTVSSAGVVPALYRMTDNTNVSLAISLHAANNQLRDILVPINKKYPIEDLMKACHYYIKAGSQKRHILFEYVMLDGINDSVENAIELGKLLHNFPAKINLIPFNHFPNTLYKSSKISQIKKFQNILFQYKIITTIRKTRGDDVYAACGQLSGKINDKSNRQNRRHLLFSSKK